MRVFVHTTMGKFSLRATFTHFANERQPPEQQQPFHRANEVGGEQVAPFCQLLAPCPWLLCRDSLSPSVALLWLRAEAQDEVQRKSPFDLTGFVLQQNVDL